MTEKITELLDLWEQVPDTSLLALGVEPYLVAETTSIEFQCPTPLVVNYLRRQKDLLDRHFKLYMEKHQLKHLHISLKKENE